MPTAEQILSGLTGIANNWSGLAVFWHGYFALLAAGLLGGVRPSKRLAGLLLSLPLLSVAALAWLAGNPFNGTTFALSGAAIIAIAWHLPGGRVHLASGWRLIAGALMFAFGWLYPHFLETESALPYLYAAPTGLVPCPTLSIVIGLALMLDGLGSRAWTLVVAGMGVFYGLFGALRLGVQLDWTLLVGAVVFGLAVLTTTHSKPDSWDIA